MNGLRLSGSLVQPMCSVGPAADLYAVGPYVVHTLSVAPQPKEEIVVELELRQDAWRAALAIARTGVGMQRVGVAKARCYQRASNAADF